MRLGALVLALVGLLASGASAPVVAAEPSSGGQPACAERSFGGDIGIKVTLSCRDVDGRSVTVLMVTGDIETGDDRIFRQALLAADSGPVIVSLESEGGDLAAGIAIGRAIWLSEAATVVEDGECASACALAWLAGRPRYMAQRAAIGFHAPWRDTGTKPEASTGGSAVVGGYLRDLGLTSEAIRYINEPGPDELRYLTFDDADALNIAVRPWTSGVEPVAGLVPPEEEVPEAGATFRDCEDCPDMVVVPGGSFMMGSPDDEAGRQADESPRHEVRFAEPFAVGRTEVTFDEWAACVAEGGCNDEDGSRDDAGWGRGTRPVINVSWEDARAYADWLSLKTGRAYRLPSEAEWEYAARGGTVTSYATGATLDAKDANVDGEKTVPVGSYPANAFGLLDMHGNVWEWVADCYADSYRGAPGTGAAVSPPGCDWRVVRGAGWNTTAPENMRTAFRLRRFAGSSRDSLGFRVARAIGPETRAGRDAP